MSPMNIPPGTYIPGTILSLKSTKLLVDRFLAQGGFAHVYVVQIGPTHAVVESDFAAQAPNAVLKRVACPDKESLLDLENEIIFMRQLNGHKNIVKYIDSSVQKLRNGGGFEVFILMEYCRGGHLVDFLNTRLSNRLSETEVLKIFSDVCEAVAHMHYSTPPIIHRDIKVENVLIANDRTYKLCDFGSATVRNIAPGTSMSAQEIRILEDEVGKYTTLQYRAPELCDLYQKKGLTEKMDMWALGVLLYKLCFFTTPFEDSGTLAILNVRYSMPTQPSYSRNVLGLIESMLNADVGGRADIYQVYSTVCRIRGLPCNLHNQYSIVSPVPAVVTSANSAMAISPSIVNNDLLNPNANQQYLQPLAGGGLSINPLSSLGSNSIAPSPTVSPMRRGRPPKHSKTPSSGSLNADGVSTPPILNVDLMNSPHNPFNTDSRPARSNRLTAPPDFFATADFNNNSVSQDVIPHGLPTNTSSHRLTAPPSFFTNVQTMDVTGLGTYSLSNGGQAYPSRRTSSSSGPMQVPFESQSFNIPTFTALPSNPQFPAESSAPQPQFPQSHQQAFAQQGPDPFDPFGAQIRRDSTRSIPNLKVAVNATPTPTPIPPHLISPRSFTKSTSEVRLNALGDSSVRMHGHSRNKSWAQTHTAAHGQYQPKPPTSASAHHSRNASKDSFDSASTGSSAGVNVAGLVRQFQQSATIGEQQGMDSAFSSAASTHVQQPSMQYSRHSSVSGPSSPGFLSPNRPGSGSIGINLPPSGTLPNHIQAHQNAPPPKPPRNLELPPAHTPMAVFPSAMPSPMTPLPPSVMFDPFTVPSSAWVQMNSGQSDLHGGRGNSWDAFNLNPGSIAQPHQQPQPQQPQHQPRSQPLRSDVSADRKADEFLRGLMER